jgi:hypothetical protein
VFVTLDQNLGEISGKLAAELAEKMKWRCTVVGTAEELRAALASLIVAPEVAE